jgi:hypothetical protein
MSYTVDQLVALASSLNELSADLLEKSAKKKDDKKSKSKGKPPFWLKNKKTDSKGKDSNDAKDSKKSTDKASDKKSKDKKDKKSSVDHLMIKYATPLSQLDKKYL